MRPDFDRINAELRAGTLSRDAFDELRDELRRAAWWTRAWTRAHLFTREARIGSLHRVRRSRVYARYHHVRMTELQAWRVRQHEQSAWGRIGWLCDAQVVEPRG